MEFLPTEMYGVRVYAGFWQRLGAGIIDALIYAPIFWLLTLLYQSSINWLLLALFISTFFYTIYNVFFHYKFGATPGKLALGIRVTQPNGSKITLKQAFLRSSVDLYLAILFMITELIALSTMNINYFNALPQQYGVRSDYIYSYIPNGFQILEYINYIWVSSEVISVLFNERKRALHDFIAGTVVINKELTQETIQHYKDLVISEPNNYL